MAGGVIVLVEQEQGRIVDVSLEALCQGKSIAEKLEAELCAVVVGGEAERLADDLGSHGVVRAWFLEAPPGAGTAFYANALHKIVVEQDPQVIVGSPTAPGRDISIRLAAKLKANLLSGCASVEIKPDGSLAATRPVFEGRFHASVASEPSRPQVVSFATGSIDAKARFPGQKAEIIKVQPAAGAGGQKVVGRKKAPRETMGLDESEIIVSAGGGVGKDNLHLIEELAEALGAVTAASRIAVDNGWFSPEKLIGQSGKVVSPKLYIACGISGSVYHTTGMKDSQAIVAINKDRGAPILGMADVGVVADVAQVLPPLIARLREAKAGDSGKV